MPRVPLYEPNRVAPASTTGARFQAASNPGNIGQSVARLGGAMGEFADAQDKIEAQFDDTASRRMMLDYQKGAAAIKANFESLEGMSAVEQRQPTEEQLKKLYDETIGKASNPRMKSLATLRIEGLFAEDTVKIGSHSVKQLNVETDKTQLEQINMAAEEAAANWTDPELLKAHINTGVEVIDAYAQRKGYSEQRTKSEVDKFKSNVHKRVASNLMVADDIDGAAAYLDANADEMLWADELALRADLKKPLEDRQALTDYQSAIAMIEPIEGDAPAPAAAGDIKALIRGPESGGNDGAVNQKGSSASGRYQFIKGTFVDLYQEVYGVDADTANAAWSKDRFNAAVQEKLMDRLLAKNSKVLRDNGQAVDNGNLYVMHVLGSGNGPKLLNANPNDPVANHLSAEIVSKNPTYFGGGKTVAEALGVIRSKVGGSATSAPRTWDKASVYAKLDQVAEVEGWTPERLDRAKDRADKEIARDEQLLARQESQADRQASEVVIGLGDNFKDVSQIPKEVRERMNPGDLAKYQAAAERNANPSIPANGDTQLALNLMRISNPDQFKELSLGQYRGMMTPAEFDTMVTKQAELRNAAPEKFTPRSQITSTISWAEKYGGLGELKDEDRIAVYDIMDNILKNEYKQTGKAPTEEQAVAALRMATRQYKTVERGVLWDSKGEIPVYRLTADNIPAKERKAMEDAFKRQYGRLPTDDELTKLFRMRRAGQ